MISGFQVAVVFGDRKLRIAIERSDTGGGRLTRWKSRYMVVGSRGVKLSEPCLFSLSLSARSCLSGVVVLCCVVVRVTVGNYHLGHGRDLVKRKHTEVTSSYYPPPPHSIPLLS
jgi:hypothetical protein